MKVSLLHFLFESPVGRRLTTVLCIAGYVWVFNWTYGFLVVPRYASWGLGPNTMSLSQLTVSWVLCLLPALWMPLQFSRPSQILFLLQYLMIFIPSAFVLYSSVRPALHSHEALSLLLLMFVGLTIIQGVYCIPLLRIPGVRVPRRVFTLVVLFLALLLGVYVVAFLGTNFQVADLVGIYRVRAAMSDLVRETGSRFGLYAQMWLAGFILPLAFAIAALTRRWWLILPVGLGYLVLFGIGGNKTTLFAPIYLLLVYGWLRFTRRYAPASLAVGLALLLFGGVCLSVMLPGSIDKWYVGVIHFRSISLPSLLIAQYYEFLKYHPVTHLSHVSLFGLFSSPPYVGDVSMLIGTWFYGVPVGCNAGFWAGDGLLGFGPIGIVLMSIICAALFWLFDSLSRPFDPRFVAIAATVAAVTFTNASLFTTLLSGGLGLLMVVLLTMPREGVFHILFRPMEDSCDLQGPTLNANSRTMSQDAGHQSCAE